MNVIESGLYRILGNDLPPRHSKDQTVINADFILQNEEGFAGTRKIFCLNRIVDQEKVKYLREQIEFHGHPYFEIPFDLEEYRELKTPKQKMMYLTNVNPARNACIRHSRESDDHLAVILCGNAFLRRDGWTAFENFVYDYPPDVEAAYALPCMRVKTNEELLSLTLKAAVHETYHYGGNLKVTGMRELYLAFSRHCDVMFNEDLPYGVVDKVYTLWQLGMQGPWDRWEPQLRRQAYANPSKHFGTVKVQGYACRMPSHSGRDGNNLDRGAARNEALPLLIRKVDEMLA